MAQNLLYLPTALGCQLPEGLILAGIIAEQVGSGIVEGPLGMTGLAAYQVFGSGMGRMAHERNCVGLIITFGVEEIPTILP